MSYVCMASHVAIDTCQITVHVLVANSQCHCKAAWPRAAKASNSRFQDLQAAVHNVMASLYMLGQARR